MKSPVLFICLALVSFSLTGQGHRADSLYVRQHFEKMEYDIPMRDGVKLHTIAYVPLDKGKAYPILMNRTCYSVGPYGKGKFKTLLGPSTYTMRDGYIFVYQDVRGRYMSEGAFDNMTPNITGNDPRNKKDIDESSDTWDTIEFLLKNIKGHNGRVGMWGISYPGFYTAAAIPDAHPALKASSPQAPISDFFFDDFHHHGAFLQSYLAAFAVFGYQKDKPTSEAWFDKELNRFFGQKIADNYDFNLSLGPLKNATEKYHHDNFFWKQIVEHPHYDDFWQKRNLLPHLKNVKHAVMTVGGWFDAEDLYGPLNIYRAIEHSSPSAYNILVMGPWAHGQWSQRDRGALTHNHIYFGDSINAFYQRDVERKFFAYHLKNEGQLQLPEAFLFDTGKKEWKSFNTWPPENVEPMRLYFAPQGKLSINKPVDESLAFEYISDPQKPVPYTSQTEGMVFTPSTFMSDDQREASRRPDVLTFESDILTQDVTLAGEIMAKLKVSMTGTDADFIVKLIDVYPQDHPNYPHNAPNIKMGGYQQLVRHETMRGRYRKSFEKPEPFKPGAIEEVDFQLQDILHTFKKGHKVMVQIHSTWFPYIDRNPQKYVDNIYKAEAGDFIKSTIRVYGSSVVEVGGKQKKKVEIQLKR